MVAQAKLTGPESAGYRDAAMPTGTSPASLRLAHLPTPMEPAPRLSSLAGGVRIWLKRDDCTGLAMGGNKARKLEYLLPPAIACGADTIVTFGGVQSNHTRSTAAAARRLGLECRLLMAGSPPAAEQGNLLLCRVLGASITFLSIPPAELTAERVEREFQVAEQALRGEGRKPFRIPPGGSTPLGVLGYVRAFDEMLAQSRDASARLSHLIVAFGTGATLSGLILGNVLAGRPVRITGISVAPPGMPASLGLPPVASLVTEAAALLGERVSLEAHDVRILYEHAGRAYAAPTAECLAAIRGVARTEGIFLDPVYTGKAMAGLLDMCRNGTIAPGEEALFVHTGGAPGIFPYAEDLSSCGA